MCRKPALTIRPSELISPCSSALVATVVPWARPATLSGAAPAAARILFTPRTSPIAGFAGVLATLVTSVAPDTISTDTISVNVPPVSIPMRRRADAELVDMLRTALHQQHNRVAGRMGQPFRLSQKPNIDGVIGISDPQNPLINAYAFSISRNFSNAASLRRDIGSRRRNRLN